MQKQTQGALCGEHSYCAYENNHLYLTMRQPFLEIKKNP